MKTNDEVDKFWQSREQEYDSEIKHKFFASLIGTSDGEYSNKSGIAYLTKDRIVFEDFEKRSPYAFIFRKKEKYVKYKIEFRYVDIKTVKKIRFKDAYAILQSKLNPNELSDYNPVLNFFSIPALLLITKDEHIYCFEITRLEDFIKFCRDKISNI